MQKCDSPLPSSLQRTGLPLSFNRSVKSGLMRLITTLGHEEIIEHLPDAMMTSLYKSILQVSPKELLVNYIFDNKDKINPDLSCIIDIQQPITDNSLQSSTDNANTDTSDLEIPPTPSSNTETEQTETVSNEEDSTNAKVSQRLTDVSLKEAKTAWKNQKEAILANILKIETPFPDVCDRKCCRLCISFLYSTDFTPCHIGCDVAHGALFPHVSKSGLKKLKYLHSLEIRERPVISDAPNCFGSIATVLPTVSTAIRNQCVAPIVYANIVKIFNNFAFGEKEVEFDDTDEDNPAPSVVNRKRNIDNPSIISSRGHRARKKACGDRK